MTQHYEQSKLKDWKVIGTHVIDITNHHCTSLDSIVLSNDVMLKVSTNYK